MQFHMGTTLDHKNRKMPMNNRHPDNPSENKGLTSRRKQEHIDICLAEDVEFRKSNGFEKYEFEHRALPELNLSDIDTSLEFFGKPFELPFFIEAITGGAPGTEKLNLNLAKASEEMGIGMGTGSQRAMLDDPDLKYTYMVRDVAPNIFLLGNIGAVQLARLQVNDIDRMIKEIKGDGLAIHLNAAQEMCQPEGDTDWRDVLANIERICRHADFPVIIKETGCGISADIAKRLESAGVGCLDIGGAGGTSFTRVEHYRGSESAAALSEWGIPTAESLQQCRKAVNIPIIASGGMRTGVECAKALAMGASLVGFALPVLKAAQTSHQAVVDKLTSLAEELKRTMLLLGTENIEALKKVRVKPL
jgi:isopentenyl-diphosphate delta-isomerase